MLLEFLADRCSLAETIESGSMVHFNKPFKFEESNKLSNRKQSVKSEQKSQNYVTVSEIKCFCCQKFKMLPVAARWGEVKRLKLCTQGSKVCSINPMLHIDGNPVPGVHERESMVFTPSSKAKP
ncbi:hypothetical protein JTB14_001451 [Gonioctena quinquepunctata]|nr:hypothetical protein JTB14_001451 [Gonioctena quinquepunctata]